MLRHLRVARRLARAAIALIVAYPIHHALLAAGRRSPWVQRFLGMAGRAFGLVVSTRGTPLKRDVLYVANHVSWLDILAIGGATGAAFVSKDDVARWPVVGGLARIGGTIFIRRRERSAVHAQSDALAAALASGRPAALFPEGTTGDGVTLLPFRASLFDAVERVGRPVRVQPIAIDYGVATARVAWHGDEPVGENARRILEERGAIPVTLHFLAPIETQGCDRKALAAASREAIADALPRAPAIAYRPAP